MASKDGSKWLAPGTTFRSEPLAAGGFAHGLGVHPALAALTENGTPSGAAVEAFIDKHAFPLVEPGAATFVFRGAAHEVSAPVLHPWRCRPPLVVAASRNRPLASAPRLSRTPAASNTRSPCPRDGHEDWIVDPFNPTRAGDPFGENSVCRTFGYARPAWSEPRGAARGRIEDIAVESPVFGETRRERVYVPAGYDPSLPCPLVIVHDGEDFVSYADLPVVLDNLIASGDIPPVIAALVQTRDRTGEYADGRRHARYLVRDLLPALGGRWSLADGPRNRVLLGASLGAVASLATMFRFPGIFGGLVLLSGSFIFDERKLDLRPHPVFHKVARLVKAMRHAPRPRDVRAFVSTGELEGLAAENRALADFLREGGVDVLFKGVFDGHHWHNWRDQLRGGLAWALLGKAERHD